MPCPQLPPPIHSPPPARHLVLLPEPPHQLQVPGGRLWAQRRPPPRLQHKLLPVQGGFGHLR